MKNKKVLALAMAAAMMVAPITASAEEWQGPTGNGVGNDEVHTGDKAEFGHTTFSVIEAKQNPNNVSFEVPLYVTMAAIDGETDLIVPENYSITNTSAKLVGAGGVNELNSADAFDIAVIKMDFSKLAGSTYNTVASGGGAKGMVLTVGGATMPALSEAGTESVDLKSAANKFHDGSKFVAIPAIDKTVDNVTITPELVLPIVATLGAPAEITENAGAAAQFKITYTVSALDGDGNLMGSVYAGDDKALAGLDN